MFESGNIPISSEVELGRLFSQCDNDGNGRLRFDEVCLQQHNLAHVQ